MLRICTAEQVFHVLSLLSPKYNSLPVTLCSWEGSRWFGDGRTSQTVSHQWAHDLENGPWLWNSFPTCLCRNDIELGEFNFKRPMKTYLFMRLLIQRVSCAFGSMC